MMSTPEKRQPSTRSFLIAVARWLAVIPGALIAALLVSFPIRWAAVAFQLLPNNGEAILTDVDGRSILKVMPLDDLERLGMAATVPAVLILVAARIAPKFKFLTSIIVATSLSVFIVGALIFERSGALVLESGVVPHWIMFSLWAASIVVALFVAKSGWEARRSSHQPQAIYATSDEVQNDIPPDIEHVQTALAVYGVVLARDKSYPDAWTFTRPAIDRFARVIRVASRARYVTGPDVKERYLTGDMDRTAWLVAMVLDLPHGP